ncbi:hypothetical protein BGZ97_006038 [Linnemannia gamsii]|uniref:F-box domain-containing protein n=1 Tax=Linnemannia gamsii TaxID=64522 RepID=A0A9P6QRD0_9FUNG|nr:hypothetical protein BGZ97_006038 [Linnemannia gamsii]
MSSSISIFDIALIVDSIYHFLLLPDLQICRRVNKQWSLLFKPHSWSHQKLPLTAVLTKNRIDSLIDHKRWIRTLTMAAPHIEKVSALGFTHLEEIILYDQNYECSYYGKPTPSSAIESLLDNNPDLKSLEIDLNRYHYQISHKLSMFSAGLMLAIERHPSLTRLVWHVPEGHMNDDFARSLFYMCLQRPLHELYVLFKQFLPVYCNMCGGGCFDESRNCDSFHMNGVDHFKMLPELRRFQQAVRKMAVDSGKPFAFRKLGLSFEFRKYYLPLLRNCPDLQEVLFDLPGDYTEILLDLPGDYTEILEVLARCPTLRGLDLGNGGYQRALEREIHRFSQLQTVRFQQQCEGGFQLQKVLDSLRSSSQNTLEVMNLCMSAVDPEDVVSIIRSFPNLKEIDMDTFKIYLRESDRSTLEADVPGAENPSLQVRIVQNWDPLRLNKPHGAMSEWWDYWYEANDFICEMWIAYLEKSRKLELPSIRVRFMYPIKAFMSEKEANDYAERSGAWESSESQTLMIEDVSRMMKAEE